MQPIHVLKAIGAVERKGSGLRDYRDVQSSIVCLAIKVSLVHYQIPAHRPSFDSQMHAFCMGRVSKGRGREEKK